MAPLRHAGRLLAMRKLSGTDAFVVVDLDGAAESSGLIRLAPKILPSGAKELARSATYTFAAVGMRRSGASGGINTRPDGRDEAVAAFPKGNRRAQGAGCG